MKMADIAAFDNLEDLAEMAEGLATFVRQAVADGTNAHVAEKEILQRILAMGRQAMGQFLRMQGEGDVGETIEMPDGKTLRRLDEPHRRTYRSIFGPFALSRYVYGTRVGQRIGFVPLDARLELPESEYSYLLQDWAGTLSAEHAFSRTAKTLDMILGLSLPVDSLERMSRKTAESVGGFRDSLKRAPVEEEVGALFREREHTSAGESVDPVAQHKRVWSSLTSYLWVAAYLFHSEGSDEATACVRDRTLRILRGEVGYVVGGLRQMATKRKLSVAKRKKLTQVCNYFHRNRDRMRYGEYLAAGLPIASGVIEGACRHVVKDRMERAGMRWTIDGAQAMLDLRSTSINGQWSAFQIHRIKTETSRLYPDRRILHQLPYHLAT